MFVFLMNPEKWRHARVARTNSPFDTHDSEWVWTIPDQTGEEGNQKGLGQYCQ